MTGTIIFSLDCEGKWGSADKLSAPHVTVLDDAALRVAYTDLLQAFRRFEIPATFAFVAGFAMSTSQQKRIQPALRDMQTLAPTYVTPIMDNYLTSKGWIGDWAVDMVGASSGNHEIGLHGATHVPWSDLSLAAAKLEMKIYTDCESSVRNRAKTFIYPRNAVFHSELIADAGMIAYRAARLHSKVSILSDLLNPSPRADQHLSTSDPLAIAAGYFVNWRYGKRQYIPKAWSIYQGIQLIRNSIKSSGVAHFWLHPENLVSAPDTLEILTAIFDEARSQRENGKANIQTQYTYASQQITSKTRAD
jgi:hypothetical protein